MTSAEFEAFMNQMDSLSARLDKQRAKFEKEKVQIDEKIAEKKPLRRVAFVNYWQSVLESSDWGDQLHEFN